MNIEDLKKELKNDPRNPDLHSKLCGLYGECGEGGLALIEQEILAGKTVLESRPSGLGLAITSKCALRCIMCDAWKSSWEIPERTVGEVEQYLPHLKRLYWQGGEVFLSRYFKRLFNKACSNRDLRQEIVTSGLFIDKECAERLAGANLDLIFSIDGFTEKTYEYIRRGARYADLLNNIAMLNGFRNRSGSSRLTTSITVVVMKSNYKELPESLEFARRHGFGHVILTPVDHITTEENIYLHKDIQAGRYLGKIIPEMSVKASHYGITLDNYLPPIVGGEAAGKEPSTAAGREMFCYWPWKFLYIDIGGGVRPHCFCRQEVGNIAENSIEEIWNGEKMQRYREKMLKNDYGDLCSRVCLESPSSGACMGNSW